MNNQIPDVTIKMENSVFKNPLFAKPDAPQTEPQQATEVNVPQSSVRFYPAVTKEN